MTTYSFCSHCGRVNQVQTEKALQTRPTCGQCHHALPMHGLVTEIPLYGLRKILEKSRLPVVVDFWAPWCGPCRSFAPTFTKVSEELAGQWVFLKLNTQEFQEAGSVYGIRSIPTLITFHQGKETHRVSGALPEPAFRKWLEEQAYQFSVG